MQDARFDKLEQRVENEDYEDQIEEIKGRLTNIDNSIEEMNISVTSQPSKLYN